jgi:hypothetical protein
MTRRVLLAFVAIGVAIAPSAAAGRAHHAAAPRVTVKPGFGGPKTRFAVSFRAPDRTGLVGGIVRRYQARATGPARSGCVADPFVQAPFSRKGARVKVVLDPAKLGGAWCVGTYRGEVEEIQAPVCPVGKLCPAYFVLVRTVGKFTFHVKASSLDMAPPRFAGLQSAFACTPGPQAPGKKTPFHLTWTAAADDRTPSAQIMYDVYMSAVSGAEDFSKPTWTTPPGATFQTPGLPSHGTFFFVVRARDRAGNEDANRSERRGIDACY